MQATAFHSISTHSSLHFMFNMRIAEEDKLNVSSFLQGAPYLRMFNEYKKQVQEHLDLGRSLNRT